MKHMARWGVLPLLAAPVGAWALGLGDIQLQSALDQPLRAQIRLSATKDELQALDVSLADQATFQRYGLDRPAFLSTLKFTLGKDSAGHNVIRITSPEPINEPFVTMLLQATWAKGRSLREYTVLLDPPVFGTEKSAPVREAQSQPAQSAAPSAAASGAIARPRAAQAQGASPAPAPAASAPAQARTPVPASRAAPTNSAAPANNTARERSAARTSAPRASLGGSYGPVRRAETLWSIAEQVKPAGATMNQTLVALYDANPRAFEGNMNLLHRGATLRIPSRADIGNVTADSALAEVRRQTDEWRARGNARQASTGASGGQSSGQTQARLRLEPPSANTGAGAAAAVGGAASAANTAAGGAGAGGNGAAAAAGNAEADQLQNQVDQLQTQLKASRRLLDVRNQQLRDLQQQLSDAKAAGGAAAAATASSGQASAGAQLEPDQVFADGQGSGAEQNGQGAQSGKAAEGAKPEAAGSQAANGAANESTAPPQQPAAQAQSEPQAAPQPASETPKPTPEPATGPPAQQKVVSTTSAASSLLSRIIGALARPMLLIGLGAAALLVTALLYLRRRREEVEDVTGRWEALEAEADADHIDHETTERLRREAQDKDFIVEESQLAAAQPQEAPPPAEPRPAAAVASADSSATGKFEAPSSLADETLSSQTVINLDQADPVAEADFHMAYGLYDQAAELVSQAIQKDPSNRGLKLKLLEVFFVWGNKEAFLDAAKAFRTEVGDAADADWDKVIIMGKQICPDDPLFAAATAGAAEVDVALDAGDGESAALDFPLDDGAGSDAATADTGTHDAGVDLDLAGGGGDSIDLQLEGTGNHESRLSEEGAGVRASSDDALDIGEATQAGLEEALFGLDNDDTGRRTAPNLDADALSETQESPTIESAQGGFAGSDFSSLTLDSPTVESPTVESSAIHGGDEAADFGLEEDEDAAAYSAEAPTVETPTVESSAIRAGDAEAPTVETPTVETAYGGASGAAESTDSDNPTELTAEIDLDDLGLDVKDIESLPEDIGELPSAAQGETDTRQQPALDTDEDLLSATGVTQVLGETDMDLEYANTSVLGNDDATMLAPAPGDETLSSTEVLEQSDEPPEETQVQAGGVDVNLDDFDAALAGGDTVEQPRVQSFASDVFGGEGQTPVDLDVGSDVSGSDDPTGTEDMSALDPQTMTEVGTKLDLARAYIDMGDPEGARSILEEVLDEGDAGQKREAQSLIEVLTA